MHNSYDDPPDLPASKTPEPKRCKESLSEALAGAAVAYTTAVSGSGKHKDIPPPDRPGMSPGKVVDLRMKNYEQLRYLQQLYEDGILCEKEYVEQKRKIIEFLNKISS